MTTPYYEDDRAVIHHGDCLDVLRALPENSVDAIVTDPPAGIAFMGKEWDADKGGRDWWIAWLTDVMREALRVVKPGGHALVWALPRTAHWTGMALEDAGWVPREKLVHVFASGFPKSLDVSAAIDKAAGAEREIVGRATGRAATPRNDLRGGAYGNSAMKKIDTSAITAPATDAAREWEGWGTALKPAAEDWWLVRKPFPCTVASNVLTHGTGALNIDGCRVGDDTSRGDRYRGKAPGGSHGMQIAGPRTDAWEVPPGRWPANFVLSHAGYATPDGQETDLCAGGCVDGCPVAELDEQSGVLTSGKAAAGGHVRGEPKGEGIYGGGRGLWSEAGSAGALYGDSGGASRFFNVFRFEAKAPSSERPSVLKPGGTIEAWCTCGHREEDHPGHGPCIAIRRGEGDEDQCDCEAFDPAEVEIRGETIQHPTVKPVSLMRWLVRLITPPGGTVLDPFAGSGTTIEAAILEKFRSIGIEREADYLPLITQRINRRINPLAHLKQRADNGEDVDLGLLGLLDGEAS